MWEIGVIVSGVIAGLSQVVAKRQVERMSAFQSGLLRDGTVLVMVLAIVIVKGGIQIGWQAGVMFVMGITESVSIAAYFSAQREDMSATAVFSYPFSQLLIVLFAAVFFHEWKYFDIRQVQGIFNILALSMTMWLMVVYQKSKRQGRQKIRWSGMLVLSAIVVAISSLESKWAVSSVGYSPAWSSVYEFGGLVCGGIAYVLLRKQGMRVGRANLGLGILQGLLFGGGTLWYLTILTNNPLGIASLLRRVTIVLVTAGAGLWGYGEGRRLNAKQWILIGVGILVFVLVMAVNR